MDRNDSKPDAVPDVTGETKGEHTKPETLDMFLEVLAERRRRHALYFLTENSIADLETLLDYVAAQEADEWTQPAVREENLRLAVAFHQVHLPKLEDVGLIEFDDRTNTVRYRTPPTVVEVLLRVTRQIDCPT